MDTVLVQAMSEWAQTPERWRAAAAETPEPGHRKLICNSPHQRIGVRGPDIKYTVKYEDFYINCNIQ